MNISKSGSATHGPKKWRAQKRKEAESKEIANNVAAVVAQSPPVSKENSPAKGNEGDCVPALVLPEALVELPKGVILSKNFMDADVLDRGEENKRNEEMQFSTESSSSFTCQTVPEITSKKLPFILFSF